jgi:branched-subunit amino acid ABC-type transport system permease component
MIENAFYEFIWRWLTTGNTQPDVEPPLLLMFIIVLTAASGLLVGRCLLRWLYKQHQL